MRWFWLCLLLLLSFIKRSCIGKIHLVHQIIIIYMKQKSCYGFTDVVWYPRYFETRVHNTISRSLIETKGKTLIGRQYFFGQFMEYWKKCEYRRIVFRCKMCQLRSPVDEPSIWFSIHKMASYTSLRWAKHSNHILTPAWISNIYLFRKAALPTRISRKILSNIGMKAVNSSSDELHRLCLLNRVGKAVFRK